MFNKEELVTLIELHKTIWGIIELKKVSKNTIINDMKKFDIKTPKGFYKKEGSITGCPKGTKRTKSQIEAMKECFKGEKNGFYGKNHTKETKTKMSKNHADFNGDNNPFKKAMIKNPDIRVALSERLKIRWKSYSPEKLKELKTTYSLAQANNDHHKNNSSFKNHKHGHHQSLKCGKFFFRSSWEETFALYLDKCFLVSSYVGEPFPVEYFDKDNYLKYTKPDFLIHLTNGISFLVEIKPMNLMKYRNNEEKIIGLKKYCLKNNHRFQLITKQEIDDLNLIENIFKETYDK